MIQFIPYASGSAGNVYTLSDGISPLLLEAGVSIQHLRKALGNLSRFQGILASHEHMDHAKALPALAKMGRDIYITQGTADALSLSGHRIHIITPLEQFSIGPWKILPFPTIHDAAEPVGFLIANKNEKLLYATDTQYIPYKFKGLTHLAIECNYCRDRLWEAAQDGTTHPDLAKRIRWNHMGLETLLEMLRANDLTHVSEIHLLHLSDAHSDEKLFVKTTQEQTGIPCYVA